MSWLADAILFPVFQAFLVTGLLVFLFWDVRLQRPGVVTRGSASMQRLGLVVGFSVTVITLLNSAALKDGFWLKDYSMAFNLLDVAIVAYLGFCSPTCRNWLIGLFNRASVENA